MKIKRAKLITDNGFHRMVDIEKVNKIIHYPITKNMVYETPEIWAKTMFYVDIKFELQRQTKTMAIYKQVDIIRVEEADRPKKSRRKKKNRGKKKK